MYSKSKLSKALVATTMVANLFASAVTPTLAQELNKTPDFTHASGPVETVQQLERPADYPEDITEWYKKNMDTRSYVVVDGETNRILAQKEATTPYPVASMSKIIAIYLVYQAMKEGKITPDTMIKTPAVIAKEIAPNPELTNVGLIEDQEYSVRDLIFGTMLQSGNDATSSLMWHLYGSEQEGAKAMNDLLHSWGITSGKMITVSGAPNLNMPQSLWYPETGENDQNVLSAADMALVAQHLVKDFPEILKVTSAKEHVIAEGTDHAVTVTNPNQLLPDSGSEYAREGVDGLKSGFTEKAGRCFVTHSHNENGREVYAVVMGVTGEHTNSYWETEILLDGVKKHPDLYKNEQLPTNMPEMDPTTTEEASQADDTEETVVDPNVKNERNNPLTNFMRNLFSFFD